ncbi:DmpA family aminopeptidase [Granulosicoccus sp. 3-233]|uniref:DmpA family aminopeptidase n=1 Tax=Granulosicoccus sp. 3-233 TaxID=3417969 RepID=UPI003D330B29
MSDLVPFRHASLDCDVTFGVAVEMRRAITDRCWWRLPTGKDNTIADVAGVSVGEVSIYDEETVCTGVTAVLPHGGNLYRRPVPAGASVINGFGKSMGLIQLQELGEIESPILLTNTFAVPVCTSALTKRAIERNPEIGRSGATVNPLVLECNDGQVNDIQAFAVCEKDAMRALDTASTTVRQGTVGAGSGMRTFGFAGGIGSASRIVELPGGSSFTLGVLVLSNFGQPSRLRVFGKHVPIEKGDLQEGREPSEKGSIIVLMASDAPLDARQLTRLSRRSGAALGSLGSCYGHGSGDIAVAFSTANVIERGTQDVHSTSRLCETRMDAFFNAAVEGTEEAILNALWHAEPRVGYDGSVLPSFREAWHEASGGET